MTDNFYAPPHSIEAEQAVIGGLLLDDDSSERVRKVLAMLKPDSFYSRPHKILFEEITRMHREQKPVDGLTLFDELERKSLTASVGGFAYIAEIAKNTPSAANIVAYAMQVREGAFDDSVPPGETELILRLNRHGNTGTVYCIQANGAIYDTDQQSAEMRRREREEPQSKKKGGF